jgi:ABC-type cobalt transport system substrate-binding protein
MLSRLMKVQLAVFLELTVIAAPGQEGEWAGADNATAKFIVNAERQWAQVACTHNN